MPRLPQARKADRLGEGPAPVLGEAMSAVRWDSLHLATRASIELQGTELLGRVHKYWRCGCQLDSTATKVWLCDYHQGYDDGAEAVEP
jgi:hypothetical protein